VDVRTDTTDRITFPANAIGKNIVCKPYREDTLFSGVFSQSGGFEVRRRLTGGDQRKLAAGLRQYVEDRGSYTEDSYDPHRDDDDALAAGRLAWRSAGRRQRDLATKRWSQLDERRRRYDNLASQYNVLDQIGSNIIRRK